MQILLYLFYNFLLIFFSILALPFLPFLFLFKGKYRKGIFQRLGFLPKDFPALNEISPSLSLRKDRIECWNLSKESHKQRPLWLHAVSVGEVLAAIPLVKKIKEKYPFQKITLSTVTATGNYTAKLKLSEVDNFLFFPFDYPWVVKRVIGKIDPRIFIAMEGEIWPNFLRKLRLRKIPALIINGRLSSPSYKRYKWTKIFFKKVLENITFFCMQSEIDSARIMEIGAEKDKVITTGNLKFHQQISGYSLEEDKLFESLNLDKTYPVFIAGSTHRGEEEVILEIFKELKRDYPYLLLILAPRHLERIGEVESLLKQGKIKFIKRTGISSLPSLNSVEVILLDTLGDLAELYKIGKIIFVGGSLVRAGGHNVLEPALYQKAPIFGPHMDNFLEIASALKKAKGGFQVKDRREFISLAKKFLSDSKFREHSGKVAYGVIKNHQGALEKSMEVIERFLT